MILYYKNAILSVGKSCFCCLLGRTKLLAWIRNNIALFLQSTFSVGTLGGCCSLRPKILHPWYSINIFWSPEIMIPSQHSNNDPGTSWLCFLLGLKILNAWSSNNVILLQKSNIEHGNTWRLLFAWSNNIACLVEWYCLFRPEITFLCWKKPTLSVGTSVVCYFLVQQ